MTAPWLDRMRLIAAPVLLAAASTGCGDGAASGPEAARLAGVYSISDWLYTVGSINLDLSEDSRLELEFIDDEHVRGEGLLFLNVPVYNDEGELVTDKQPLLFRRGSDGPRPVAFEGWYYITRSSEADTLKFRFTREAGAGTWLENFTWALSGDWRSYGFEASFGVIDLRIELSAQ